LRQLAARPSYAHDAEGIGDHWAQHLVAARLVAAELRTERAALEATKPLLEATNGSAEHPDLYAPALE